MESQSATLLIPGASANKTIDITRIRDDIQKIIAAYQARLSLLAQKHAFLEEFRKKAAQGVFDQGAIAQFKHWSDEEKRVIDEGRRDFTDMLTLFQKYEEEIRKMPEQALLSFQRLHNTSHETVSKAFVEGLVKRTVGLLGSLAAHYQTMSQRIASEQQLLTNHSVDPKTLNPYFDLWISELNEEKKIFSEFEKFYNQTQRNITRFMHRFGVVTGSATLGGVGAGAMYAGNLAVGGMHTAIAAGNNETGYAILAAAALIGVMVSGVAAVGTLFAAFKSKKDFVIAETNSDVALIKNVKRTLGIKRGFF